MAQVVIPLHESVRLKNRSTIGVQQCCVVVRRVAVGAVGLVLVAALTLGILQRVSGDGAPRLFGYEVRAVRSGSMTPALGVGDAVIVRTPSPSRLDSVRAGSVIMFRVPGHEAMVVTHRVAAVGHDAVGRRLFTTKGDANSSVDGVPVDDAHVIGVYAFSVPVLGRVLVGLSRWRVLATLLGAVLLACVAVALSRRASVLAAVHHLPHPHLPHLHHHESAHGQHADVVINTQESAT